MKTIIRPQSAADIGFGSRTHLSLKDYSMNPKVSVYRGDGSGRDSYIKFNNGGFRKILTNNYRHDFSSAGADLPARTGITPKFAIYKSDGYGRDSYVYSNSGGFFKVAPKLRFIQTLRSYDEYLTRKNNDYKYYANHFISPKEAKRQHQIYKIQRSNSMRLSIPKNISGGMHCTKFKYCI